MGIMQSIFEATLIIMGFIFIILTFNNIGIGLILFAIYEKLYDIRKNGISK